MKKFKFLASLIGASLMLMSCNHDSPDYETTISYYSQDLIMGYGPEGSTAPLTITSAPQVSLVRNFNNNTLVFSLNGLYTTNGVINIVSDPIPYQSDFEQNKIYINSQSVIMGGYMLDNFSFLGYINWMNISFTYQGVRYAINSRYTYRDNQTLAYIVMYDANTTVTNTPFDPSGFTTDESQYAFTFNNEGNISSLYIYDAQFASSMPAQFILIPNLTFSMYADHYQVTGTDIIPQSVTYGGDVPVPEYIIKNFTATLPFAGMGGSLSFDCTEDLWHVDATGMYITNLAAEN